MEISAYRNPLISQGLGELVNSFIGNPAQMGQAELMASQARLNNQTGFYRDEMNASGLEGELADMMIHALTAGPDYSRYAPSIGTAVTQINDGTFGKRIGSGSGGGAGKPIKLNSTDRNAIAKMLKSQGIEGAGAMVAMSAIEKELIDGNHGTLSGAVESVIGRFETGENVIDQNYAFEAEDGGGDGILTNLADMFRGPTTEPTYTVSPLQSGAPDEAASTQALNEAREAISRGADPAAVAERLKSMGVDPGRL